MLTGLALVAPLIATSGPVGPQLPTRELAAGVVQVTGGTWESNLIAISSGAGIVVVDTFDTPQATRQALEIVRGRLPGTRVSYLINTHGHDDHVWGNEVLAGIPILAHRRTFDYMADRRDSLIPFFSGQRVRELEAAVDEAEGSGAPTEELRRRLEAARSAHETWGGVDVTLPSLVLNGDAELRLGESLIELHHPGPAHSEGDLVVFLPVPGVLLVGDLVGTPNALWRLDGEQGDVVGWLAALNELQARYADRAAIVVPGHGPAGDMGRIAAGSEYLSYLVGEVRAARERGWSLAQALERVSLERLSGRESFEDLRENNIEATWRSLERLATPVPGPDGS